MKRVPGRTRVVVVLLSGFVLFCLVWPAISPYEVDHLDFDLARQGPSLSHPLGTDQFGRDLLTRLAAGGRVSLGIAVAALTIILVLGYGYGAVSGLAGGKVDALMMRVLDGLLALPRLPVSLVMLVVLNQTAKTGWAVVLALSIVSWMLTARLVRGQVLVLRQTDYVRAARALGARGSRILLRHLLPNTLGILVVAVLLELPGVILGEAFLAQLGLGLNPPTPSWGNMALEGVRFHRIWVVALPSAAIAFFAVCANLLADTFQDALDPRRAKTVEPS